LTPTPARFDRIRLSRSPDLSWLHFRAAPLRCRSGFWAALACRLSSDTYFARIVGPPPAAGPNDAGSPL